MGGRSNLWKVSAVIVHAYIKPIEEGTIMCNIQIHIHLCYYLRNLIYSVDIMHSTDCFMKSTPTYKASDNSIVSEL